jgi:phage/plasmid-associated DNA primase
LISATLAIRLTPAKGKNRYICPICNGNNLTIDPKDGAYKCWSGECESKSIRDAIAPLPEKQPKKIRPKRTRHFEYLAYDANFQLSQKIRVVRVDDGEGTKRIWQEHWNGNAWEKGSGGIKLEDVAPYRYPEVLEAIKQGQPIFVVEGEPVADLLWDLDIAATTNIGGSGKPFPVSQLSEAKAIVLCPDRDKPGLKHMLKISTALADKDVRWCLAFPNSPLWNRLPDSGGLDILDWIEEQNLDTKDIESATMDRSQFAEKLQQQLAAIIELKDSREKSDGQGQKTDKLPPASEIAEKLAEVYRSKLAWESEYQMWRHYGAKHDGVWSEETSESVRGLIHSYLRSLPNAPGFTAGYVSSILTILQSDLEAKDWNEQKGLIPLRDGVLDQTTLELKPHSPGYRFTWQLPFQWKDSGIGCQPIEDFLLKITGHRDIAEVLLAFLSAIITRRSDLQRYLELIGGGGTGKSTFMALAKALAGEENVVSSQLRLLESNQFETAKFYRKLLVLFPDSERWQGEVSVLKQLTGQDPIRYERKGIQQCKDFVYEGMVILSANEPPESSDRTSGQERRKLTVGLDNRIPEYEGRNLALEFKPFLPGLLKRVLEIPRERVTALIKHTDRNVPALAQKKWLQLIETNPIASWADECTVFDPDAKSYIGKDDPEQPEQAGRWLYANFCKHQRESGHKSVLPVKRFSANLRDLLKNQLRIAIGEGRDRGGAYIQGIGLRCYHDPNGTRYNSPITGEGECDGFEGECDGFSMAETLMGDGCDECDGFFEVHQSSEKNAAFEEPQDLVEGNGETEVERYRENPSHPSHPSPISIPAIENPSPDPSQSVEESFEAIALTAPTAPTTSNVEESPLKGWDRYNQFKPYPNPKSNNIQSSQKRSLAIREAYQVAKTKEDLSILRHENGGEYSKQELLWVTNWIKYYFRAEFDHMQATAKISQPLRDRQVQEEC